MATAQEIKDRVRKAEETRIEKRANLAASVATAHAEVEELRQKLAEAERARADAVTTAERKMTLTELAGFLETRAATVREWRSGAATSKRRRRKTASDGKRADVTTEQQPSTAAPSSSDGAQGGTEVA